MQTPAPGTEGAPDEHASPPMGGAATAAHQAAAAGGGAPLYDAGVKDGSGKASGSGPPLKGALSMEKPAQSKAASKAADAAGTALSLVGINMDTLMGKKESGPPDMGALWPMQLYILWSRALKVRRCVRVRARARARVCVCVCVCVCSLWHNATRSLQVRARVQPVVVHP